MSNKDGSWHQEEDKQLREKTYKELSDKVARKQRDSLGQKKAIIERDNYINEQFNRLDLSDIKKIRREDLYNFRHWRYKLIFSSLDKRAFLGDVLIEKVPPRHTSQRCSACGWTHEKNRKGEKFKCRNCGMQMNADENASRNLALHNLQGLPRGDSDSSKGYFWNPNAVGPVGFPTSIETEGS
jgi:transposase